MIEKEEEFVCSKNHKLPIYMVVCDKNIEKNKRLLCNECMDNLETKLYNVMSFKKVTLLIEEKQKKKLEQVEYVMMINIKQVEELQKTFHQLKSEIDEQLDQLIGNTVEWIKSLQYIGQQNVNYSFFEQLDNLINQVQIGEFDYTPLITQINTINQSLIQKVIQNLNQFKSFELIKKSELLLANLKNINQQTDLMKQMNIIQEFQQSDVQLKLIDDINRQSLPCYAIVFNNTGQIMISNNFDDIIVWNFTQGRLQLSNQFKVHKGYVKCLVYSKKMNSFISGSQDQSIICWIQTNNSEWKWSSPYQQHTDVVQCLILNKQEDQLISGSFDKSIKIWNVDFIKNKLTYLYSLDNTEPVYSLSFNQSETMFASCAIDNYLIWEKSVQQKWELNCTQEVATGSQIYFLNDQQFLWVTSDYNIDQILIFELQDGVFKQNKDKTIQLVKNQLCQDCLFNFPIIYNKDKNMLLVKHKHHIYLISVVNESNLKIIRTLNCENEKFFGTMTDNAQYLVFWDHKQKKYSSYEL